jgi:hypothetical protein
MRISLLIIIIFLPSSSVYGNLTIWRRIGRQFGLVSYRLHGVRNDFGILWHFLVKFVLIRTHKHVVQQDITPAASGS